jgi:hypothetical protein
MDVLDEDQIDVIELEKIKKYNEKQDQKPG